MGSFSIWHWLIVIIYCFVIIFPSAKILKKAGYSGWWSILAILPLVNLVMFWVFAFLTWPIQRRAV